MLCSWYPGYPVRLYLLSRPYLQYSGDGNYFPVIHFNDFWLLRDKMIPMNETVTNVTLNLELGTVSMWWWQMMIQVCCGEFH